MREIIKNLSATYNKSSWFMIVAGDRANNDMAGKDPDSWMCQFQKEGCEVIPVLKGLDEYSGIRRLLVNHVKEAAARS